jgi:hypothetical protein
LLPTRVASRAALWAIVAAAVALLWLFGHWIPAAGLAIWHRDDPGQILHQIENFRPPFTHARLVAVSLLARKDASSPDPIRRVQALKLLDRSRALACAYRVKDPFIEAQYRRIALALLDDEAAVIYVRPHGPGPAAATRVCDEVAEVVLARACPEVRAAASGMRDERRAKARGEVVSAK